jgi:ABC-type arginine transport system permease subunit
MLLIAAVLAETEELAPLVLPPFAFAGIATAVFLILAIISWSFRDVANRHSEKTGGVDSHGAGH